MTGITLLGLGPGHPKYLTCQAREFLGSCSELYALEPNHPVLLAMAIKARKICPDVALKKSWMMLPGTGRWLIGSSTWPHDRRV